MNIKPRPYRSARHAATAGTIRALVIVAAIAMGYALTSLLGGGPGIVYPEATTPPAQAAPANPMADVIAAHGCWTGQAPADMAGVIPGHVVTQHGLQGPRVVGQALAQTFDGADHGLTILAFCR